MVFSSNLECIIHAGEAPHHFAFHHETHDEPVTPVLPVICTELFGPLTKARLPAALTSHAGARRNNQGLPRTAAGRGIVQALAAQPWKYEVSELLRK